MTTASHRRRRIPGPTIAIAALLVAPGAGRVLAGSWDLDAVISLGFAYDENVGVAPEAEKKSDWVGLAGVDLNLRRDYRRGSVNLGYDPTFEKYQDESQLDHLDHRAGLTFNHSWSRRSSFGLGYGFSRGERQGRIVPEDAGDPAGVIVPRGEENVITRNGASAALELAMTRRTAFGFGAHWTKVDYSREQFRSDGGDVRSLKGAESYSGELSLSMVHSSDFNAQYYYSRGKVEEDLEERDLDSLGLKLAWRSSSRSTWQFDLGATRAHVVAETPETQDETILVGAVTLDRSLGAEEGGLSAGYTRQVGDSSGTGSVAAVDTVFLGYNRPFGRRWSGSAVANWTQRQDVSNNSDLDRTTAVVNLGVEYAVTKNLGVTLGVDRIDQDDPRGQLETNYGVYRLGVSWHVGG